MPRSLTPFAVLLCTLLAPAVSAAPAPLAAPPVVSTFDLADVRLGAGPFRDARERDRAYILSLDPDRLLHTFRLNVGLPSTAEPYGGWEGPDVELRGHSLGHYLTACALMYRSTGDAAFKDRVDTIVAALAACQAAAPTAGFHAGYLSAFPESFIDRVEAQKPVWAPWYTLHKILAGLLDAHELAGNAQALDVATRMAAWVQARVEHLTREQMQGSLSNEFGGMNDALARLYAVTGDPAHLRTAQAFDHAKVFDPLARGEDQLDGLHANTQIPKAIGAALEFELTGDARYRKIAETFWERVALHRSYVIGGHSDREHFFPVDDFKHHLSAETTETCNTYNMLKLSRALFAHQPDARYMDFYERGLFNHILASQDPARGQFVYLMSLEPGHFKTYSTPENSFWCCVGTGMENHAKYGDTIFAHTADALYVNLCIAAEVDWRDRGVRLAQETDFPATDTTRLVVHAAAPTDFALRVRHPSWAAGPLAVTLNGQPAPVASTPGSYAELRRTWREGDVVEIRFPMTLRTEPLPGNDNTVALLYGPLVLAGQLGSADMPVAYTRDQTDYARFPNPPAPVFVASSPAPADLLAHVELVSRSPLLFRTRGLAQPRDVVLAPFFRVHHERYSVYWRVLTPDAFKAEQQAIAASEQTWTDARAAALDYVLPGDATSEQAHALRADRSTAGALAGRTWRYADFKGDFSYTLATKGASALELVCAYAARDTHRTTTVYVGDQALATPKPDGTTPGQIVVERYAIPPSLLAGRESITVRFAAGDSWGKPSVAVFGCALVLARAR